MNGELKVGDRVILPDCGPVPGTIIEIGANGQITVLYDDGITSHTPSTALAPAPGDPEIRKHWNIAHPNG